MRNLKKICAAAVLALTISSATAAAEDRHKVLGFIEFGKTSVSEVMAHLKGKCQIDDGFNKPAVIRDPSCFQELTSIRDLTLLMNRSLNELSYESVITIWPYEGTDIIKRVHIKFSFDDKTRKQSDAVLKTLTQMIDSVYGIRTVDEKWRTDSFTVTCDRDPGKDNSFNSIDLVYRSSIAMNLEWFYDKPEFKNLPDKDKKTLREMFNKIRELKKML